MEGIYGDPDKVDRALSQLHHLRQRADEPFSTFLPRFETLLSEAGGSTFPSIVQIAYLRESINEEMSRALIGLVLPKDYNEYTARLQDVGSQLARYTKYAPKKKSNPVNIGDNAKGSAQAEPMDWEPTRASRGRPWVNNCGCKGNDHVCGRRNAKWVSNETISYRRTHQLCLRCGNQGHMVKDCKFLPPRRPQQPMKTNKTGTTDEIDWKKAEAEELGSDQEGQPQAKA